MHSTVGTEPMSDRAIAWAELILSVLPATVTWAMFTPAMVIVGAKSLNSASVPFLEGLRLPLVLAGGFAGLLTLWSLVLPVAVGRHTASRLGSWRVLGLVLGLVACAAFMAGILNDPMLPSYSAGQWLIVYVAVSPVAVACHRVAAAAVRREVSR